MANLNFNKVILGGRLTADPELKTTTSGTMVTTFSVAVNRRGAKDQEPKVDFFNCTAWKSTAEFISRYFRKGSSICIVGVLQNRSWTDQQGNKRYATEVVVEEANFVDSKGDNAQHQNPSDGYVTPSYSTENTPEFEVISADGDLPFN